MYQTETEEARYIHPLKREAVEGIGKSLRIISDEMQYGAENLSEKDMSEIAEDLEHLARIIAIQWGA
jgi:hypothetical protein